METEVRTEALAALTAALGDSLSSRNVTLAPHTTFKIGGPARLCYLARTASDLANAVSEAKRHDIPYFVLGTGANILIRDGGVPGLVVRNEASEIMLLDGAKLRAESGTTMAKLIAFAKEHSLSGLEHFAGIPSSVGGALWQNLHFMSPDRQRTVFIAECLVGATILTVEGDVKDVSSDYFQFGYDDSILHHRRDIVLSATFQLERERVDLIQQIIDANLRWRRERHPDLGSFPSAGSIFRKIEGVGAGRLIDQCGLKGLIVGGAQVSPRHANFIVNIGGAKARDVLELVALCQEQVERRFGLRLEMEVGVVGED